MNFRKPRTHNARTHNSYTKPRSSLLAAFLNITGIVSKFVGENCSTDPLKFSVGL